IFRAGTSVATVPVGGRIGSWRLLSISHGGALVRNARVGTRELAIGSARPPGSRSGLDEPPLVILPPANRPILSITAGTRDLTAPGKRSPARPDPAPASPTPAAPLATSPAAPAESSPMAAPVAAPAPAPVSQPAPAEQPATPADVQPH